MDSQRQAAGHSGGTLWFNPPGGEENRRRSLTRDRVVTEALAIISAGGAAALSMRALATRLGVVPAALYRHVTSKEQLYDLVLDRVLAEVGCQADPALPWTGQVAALAHRLRAVLEDHPGIAALLQTRDPISPASLALAEAFLAPLRAAGLPGRQAALAFRLIYDYTLGFALSDRTSASRRAAPPGRHHQSRAARLPALPARGPVPRAGRRRRIRLGRRPRPAVHRQPRHPYRRPAGNPPPPHPRRPPASSNGTRPVSAPRWPDANIPAAAVIVLVSVMMAAQIAD
jgi:AcrR family transcriptional regulator